MGRRSQTAVIKSGCSGPCSEGVVVVENDRSKKQVVQVQEWGDFHRAYHSENYRWNTRNSLLLKKIRRAFWFKQR